MLEFNYKKTINSLNDFIKYIVAYRKNYKGNVWFRGQRSNHWKLEPTLFRNKKIDYEKSDVWVKYKLDIDFLTELKSFKLNLNKNPDISKHYNSFNDFHYMFLGQHYGLKTPALDWTTDPLIALFFAIYKYENSFDTIPLVFILKPDVLNKYSFIKLHNNDNHKERIIDEPLIIDTIPNGDDELANWYNGENDSLFSWMLLAVKSNYDITNRMSRQSGVFTMMSVNYRNDIHWIEHTFNDDAQQVTFGESIAIEPDCIEKILFELKCLGITYESVVLKDSEKIEDECKKAINDATIIEI